MKTSDLMVKCLENEGIEYIFGVPGEENADFMMSLEGSSIQFVLTRHEQGAAFMAEVYGRLTGNPAGCLGTLGPGATNLLTGVADADMDRAPLLCLTGQGSTARTHKESHQIMDVVGMFEPVTKWAHQITEPNSVPEIIRKAVRTARREKPGAVLIELPENIAKEEATVDPIQPKRFRRPVPADKIVDQAWDLLKAAKSPVIIAGNGAIRRRASNMLREFCEQTGVGVVSTFMGKGAVDMDAPYSLYTIGLGQRDHIVDVMEQADLVITLGYDMVEYPPAKWNLGGDQAKVIHIDFEPAEIDRDYDPDVEIVGDLAHSLWMINERMAKDGVPSYDLDLQRDVRQRMADEFAQYADDDTEGTIRPQKAIWDVRQAMGPHDVVISGVGAHKMWTARYYQCHEPNTCLIPNGFCSMGMPLPGVIAAHLVNPERKVLGIAGDGDFMMNVQEMETAARLNADVNMLVWVDGGYGLIAWKQHDEFKRHTDLAFGNPDWLGLAETFGWQGQWVPNARDLRGALDKALAHKGPSLIAIPIDYRENQLLTERLGKIQVNN